MTIQLSNRVVLDEDRMRLAITVATGEVKYVYVNRQECNLLKELYEKPAGQIVESTELVTRALESVKQVQGGGIPTLNVVVSKLRRKVRSAVGADVPLIQTYWGRGYSRVPEDGPNEEARPERIEASNEGKATSSEQAANEERQAREERERSDS